MEIIENQQKDISVYVLAISCGGSYHGALYKVKLEHVESSVGAGLESSSFSPQGCETVVKFFDKDLNLPKYCFFEGARFGSRSKLHVMVDGPGFNCKPITTNNSFVFDTDKTSVSGLQHFSPPKAAKPYGALISAYGMLYYVAGPQCYPCIPDPSFERYNPSTNLWESLPSLPYDSMPTRRMEVVGYAVCYGYILLSLYGCRVWVVMAFHIGTQTWHEVNVTKSRYRPLEGRAVVLNGIIYSMSSSPNQVLAFCFIRTRFGECHLSTPVPLRVRNTAKPPSPMVEPRTQNLVHLGLSDFCLVQTGDNEYSNEYQYLCVTTFRIFGGGGKLNIRTLHSSVFKIEKMAKGCSFLDLNFSFTPDCEDFDVEEEYYPSGTSEFDLDVINQVPIPRRVYLINHVVINKGVITGVVINGQRINPGLTGDDLDLINHVVINGRRIFLILTEKFPMHSRYESRRVPCFAGHYYSM